jgi:hypothetical protein
MPACWSRRRCSERWVSLTMWKAFSPCAMPSLMKGRSTRYSSSLLLKNAQTCRDRPRTVPASRTCRAALFMTFVLAVEPEPHRILLCAEGPLSSPSARSAVELAARLHLDEPYSGTRPSLGSAVASACAKQADAFFRISLALAARSFRVRAALAFIGRQAQPLAGIVLALAHPPADRLGLAAELPPRSIESQPTATDAQCRAPVQTRGALPHFRRIATRCQRARSSH